MLKDPTISRLLPGHAGRGRPAGKKPNLITYHIQEGANDLYDFFGNSLPQSGPSAADSTAWCRYTGQIDRLLNDTDTPWTNGLWVAPDLTDPVIAQDFHNGDYSGDDSLTIEHQGFAPGRITDAQVEATAQLTAYWCQRWAIPCDRDHIVGHYQVGPHKQCPGAAFPFERVIARAQAILAADAGSSVTGDTGHDTTQDDPNSHHFAETNQTVVNYIADPANNSQPLYVGFWDRWKQDGLDDVGYPITGAAFERSPIDGKTYLMQWYQRVRYEFHPEQTDPKYRVMKALLGQECLDLRNQRDPLSIAANLAAGLVPKN